jgi:prevent-host-death family protein
MTMIGTKGATHEIQLRDAKAALSAVIDQARQEESLIIIRHGPPEDIMLSFEHWRGLSQMPSCSNNEHGRCVVSVSQSPDRGPATCLPVREPRRSGFHASARSNGPSLLGLRRRLRPDKAILVP